MYYATFPVREPAPPALPALPALPYPTLSYPLTRNQPSQKYCS